MRVVIAGGGTAGHVVPAIEVARSLVARGHAVSFIGTSAGQEATLVPAAGYRLDLIDAVRLRRAASPSNLLVPVRLVRAVARSRRLLRDLDADVVLGMGGYVSLPVGIAARLRQLPLVIHEQNAVPGLANRLLARLARRVAVSFDDTARLLRSGGGGATPLVTGNPVRDAIARVSEERATLRAEAREQLGLDPVRPTVIAFGGSLGALRIGRAVIDAYRRLADTTDVQVLLLTGASHLGPLRAETPGEDPRLLLRASEGNMERVYAAADLIVSRAGASTCAELLASGTPAIIVPYPHATADHQTSNARILERAGAAEVITDGELSGTTLAPRIQRLLADRGRVEEMSRCARRAATPDAAARLVGIMEAVA